MFYNNLLCFLVAIFVFSASNPPEKPWLPPVVALALLLASLWLFAAVAGRQFAAAASAGRYFRAERRLSFLAVGLFVALVGLLDLKYYLQPLSLGDRLPVLTDIGGLAVFFLLLALVWHQGRRRYMQLFHSRYSAVGFLWSNLKANLPAVLPWLILSLVFDLLQLVPYPPLARFLRSAYGELALFGLFVVFLVLFFPPLVRVLWNCRPLPPGPLREHIASFCRAQGFRSEVLCWPLFEGQVLTAGIIGILPGLRYLLITRPWSTTSTGRNWTACSPTRSAMCAAFTWCSTSPCSSASACWPAAWAGCCRISFSRANSSTECLRLCRWPRIPCSACWSAPPCWCC